MASASNIHPVRFNHLQHCSQKDGRYRQLVNYGDVTQFQMQMDICNPDTNMVLNPAFSSTDNWGASGSAFIDIYNGWGQKFASNTSGQLYQIVPVNDGVYVYISFDLTIQNGSMKMAAGSYTEIFEMSGTYSRWIEADSLTQISFSGAPAANWTITSVGMYAVNTNFSVQIVDIDDNVIREMNPLNDPQYFDFTRQWFTFSYDWEDSLGENLPEGCYRFLVSDPCDCLNGGLIPADLITGVTNYWDQASSPSWIIFNGTATYNGLIDGDDIWIENVFCDDVEYTISYTLSGMAGNKFQIRAGATAGAVRIADGTYTETLTANGNNGRFVMFGYNTAGASAFQLTDLSITRSSRGYGFRSNLFDLQSSTECTCIISACCDSDNLQAGYIDTAFSPRIRLRVNYGDAEYEPISRETFKSSFGYKSSYFYRGEKTKLLSFAAAEYVHDFMGHLGGYDHVYLDGDEKFINSNEYSVEFIKGYDYGEAEIRISDKSELILKKRCSSTIKGCDDGGLNISIDGAGGSDGAGIVTDSATPDEYLTSG
jgi:hypothetical protein